MMYHIDLYNVSSKVDTLSRTRVSFYHADWYGREENLRVPESLVDMPSLAVLFPVQEAPAVMNELVAQGMLHDVSMLHQLR